MSFRGIVGERLTLRVVCVSACLLGVVVGGCSSSSSTPGSGGSGGKAATGGASGTGGSTGTGGASGTGGANGTGGSTGTGGSPGTGGRGTGGGSGTGGMTGAGGTGAPRDGGSATDGASDAARDTASDAGTVSSTATATFGSGAIRGMAVFTQVGMDVTVRVDITGCSAGAHQIFIGSGFSCDSTALEGGVWDTPRGPIGPNGQITCAAGNTGTLTYTRVGGNPATQWTVADHAMATDVTNHVVLVSSVNDVNTRQGCANFF